MRNTVLTFALAIAFGLHGCGGGSNNDTTPPVTPTLTSAPSAYINTNSVAVEVNGEVGSAVFVNESATGIVIGSSGKAAVNLDTSGADGVKNFNITLKDAALNTSGILAVSTEKGTTPPTSVNWSTGGGYEPFTQYTLESNLRLIGNVSFVGATGINIVSTKGGSIAGVIIDNVFGELLFSYLTPSVDPDILHITGTDKFGNAISIIFTVPLPY